MKKKIDLNQPFVDFLKETLQSSKENKTTPNLTRVCNVLIGASSRCELKDKTVKDVLELDAHNIMIYRGFGPSSKKGYFALQKVFFESGLEMDDWPFLRVWELIETQKEITTKERFHKLKVKVKTVRVRTDPETKVFEVTVNGGKGIGIWKETMNSPRGVHFFFRGLQAMACFAGLPLLELPPIPKSH